MLQKSLGLTEDPKPRFHMITIKSSCNVDAAGADPGHCMRTPPGHPRKCRLDPPPAVLQKSLGLTEEQKRDLMIARTFVLTSLSSLLQERAQLAASLQVKLQGGSGCPHAL